MSTFIQIFRKFFLKKNQTIWCLRLSKIWKILTSSFNNLLNYKPKENIWNKIDKSSKTVQDKNSFDIYFFVFFNLSAKI